MPDSAKESVILFQVFKDICVLSLNIYIFCCTDCSWKTYLSWILVLFIWYRPSWGQESKSCWMLSLRYIRNTPNDLGLWAIGLAICAKAIDPLCVFVPLYVPILCMCILGHSCHIEQFSSHDIKVLIINTREAELTLSLTNAALLVRRLNQLLGFPPWNCLVALSAS